MRIMPRWTIGLCLTLLAAHPMGFAQRPPAGARSLQWMDTPPTLPWLETRVPELNVEQAPLEEVLDYLAGYSKTNLVVRWSVLEGFSIRKDTAITLKIRNLKLSQVLWLILNQAGGADVRLAYRATSNLLLISTAADLGREMIVKIYDVSDLLARVPNFAGPSIDLARGGDHGAVFTSGQGERNSDGEEHAGGTTDIDRLVELIQQIIEPDSWQAVGGHGSIRSFGQKLAVLNTIEVHEKLGGYLREPD